MYQCMHWNIHRYIYYILFIYIYVYTFILYFYIIGKWFCHQYFCLVVDVVGDFSWGHKIQCIEYTIDWKKSKVCCRERYNRTILYRLEVNSNYKLINLFNPTYYLKYSFQQVYQCYHMSWHQEQKLLKLVFRKVRYSAV